MNAIKTRIFVERLVLKKTTIEFDEATFNIFRQMSYFARVVASTGWTPIFIIHVAELAVSGADRPANRTCNNDYHTLFKRVMYVL